MIGFEFAVRLSINSLFVEFITDISKSRRQNPVLFIAHGDETSWRIDGQGAQLWYAGNRDLAFYLADPSRGGDVALSIFGENWPGNLVADDYAGITQSIQPAVSPAWLI